MEKSTRRLPWQRLFQMRPHTFMIIVAVVAVVSWFAAMWAKEEYERTSFMKKYASGPFRIETLYDMGSPFNPQEPALSRHIGAFLSTATGPRTSNWVKVIGPAPPKVVARCIYLHPEIECLDVDSRSVNEDVARAASGLEHLKYFRVLTWVENKGVFGPIGQLPSTVEVAFLDGQMTDDFVKLVSDCDATVTYISYWQGSLQEHQLNNLIELPHLAYLGYATERSPNVPRPFQGTGILQVRPGNSHNAISQVIAAATTSRPIQVIQEPVPPVPQQTWVIGAQGARLFSIPQMPSNPGQQNGFSIPELQTGNASP